MPAPQFAARLQSIAHAVVAWRFAKFAVVGGLGTLVNMLCLWLTVQWLFAGSAKGFNLVMAQLLAIAVATLHNFAWNRLWTWKDRQGGNRMWQVDLGRYVSVAALSISLQLLCVALLREYVHYLIAAALGIALASVAAFLLNDRWSFRLRGDDSSAMHTPMTWQQVFGSVLAGLLAVCAYLYAIDSSLIPKNGDENVYLHIARVTGTAADVQGVNRATGLLPLKSDLNNMRNTKPPLLFFQARLATELRGKWDIAVLRLPSLLYTFATAGLIVAAGMALRLGWAQSLAAALLWLAFFATFRFGRPFLTTAPEVFWLFGAFVAVIKWPLVATSLRTQMVWTAGVGTIVGLGLLHKSFALALPVGLGLGLVLCLRRLVEAQAGFGSALVRSGLQAFAVCVIGLAMFALWFAFDPDPRAVWQEFVLGENLGKLGAEKRPWLSGFLSGGESVWVYGASVLLNPGLLAVAGIAGLCITAKTLLTRGATLRQHALLLCLVLWAAAWIAVFALPSQRSARYALPAMPAVALLLAMVWHRIPAWVLRLNFVLIAASALAAVLLGGLVKGVLDPFQEPAWTNLVVGVAALTLCAVGLWRPKAWALSLPVASLLVYLGFATAFRPLDADRFPEVANKHLAGVTVAVPCNFRAKFEEHRLLLPRANVVGVHERAKASAAELASVFPAFVVRTSVFASSPPQCKDCEVMGARVVFKSRHSSDEIKSMLGGQWTEHLLGREWLMRVKPLPKGEPPIEKPAPSSRLVEALATPEARCL